MSEEKPIKGELIRAPAPGYPSSVYKTLHRLISRLSVFPFFNRFSKRALDSAREVIEAQNKLGQTLIEHQRTSDKLRDIGTILKTDRVRRAAEQQEAEVRRANAERAYQERFIDNRISQQHKDQQVKRMKSPSLILKLNTRKR